MTNNVWCMATHKGGREGRRNCANRRAIVLQVLTMQVGGGNKRRMDSHIKAAK